ncbi:hypothetical protein CDD83_4418 [Cordyceps sp. RAO-2017]|nr:hypothetical protein CDD83_4418 [Cordyceps sp. RAO-2017]
MRYSIFLAALAALQTAVYARPADSPKAALTPASKPAQTEPAVDKIGNSPSSIAEQRDKPAHDMPREPNSPSGHDSATSKEDGKRSETAAGNGTSHGVDGDKPPTGPEASEGD